MSGTRAISTTSRPELSSSFFFLEGKAPKEIHAILTEALACFLSDRVKDLSAPLYTNSFINPIQKIGFTLSQSFPAALRPWDRLILYQKWVPGVFPGSNCRRFEGQTSLPHICLGVKPLLRFTAGFCLSPSSSTVSIIWGRWSDKTKRLSIFRFSVLLIFLTSKL